MAHAFHGSALGRRRHAGSRKGFSWLKAHKQLPVLQAEVAARKARAASSNEQLVQTSKAA